MALSRAAYRNFSSTQINSRMSNTCTHSVNGSNVDCTDITTTKIETVLGLSGTNSLSTFAAASSVNHWSAWGPTTRSTSGSGTTKVLVNSHPSNSNLTMGCWAGYNHSAVTPHYDSGGSNTYAYVQSGGSYDFTCTIDIGELLYNDVSGADTVSHVFFSVWDGSSCSGYYGLALSSATDGTGDSNSILTFSGSAKVQLTSLTTTKTYTCKIWFCESGTWDYTGTYFEYKLSELADWTVQIRIKSANHWYLNGPYNSSTTDGDGTFTSGNWDVNNAQITLSTGYATLYALSLNSPLGGSWGGTAYDYMNLYFKIEEGYYDGSTWYGTQQGSSVLCWSGSWNQSYYVADFSSTDVWTPGTGMDTSGYGYRFILDCQTS